MKYYAIVILVYFGTDLLAAWGLNLEFGVAGVANLGYILLVATGAYAYAILTLAPSSGVNVLGTYVGGYQIPAGVALVVATVVAGLVGALIGLIGSRRIRQDYFAITMFGAEILAWTLVTGLPKFLNGPSGLYFIPSPAGQFSWSYVVLVGAVTLAGLFVMRRFTTGPMGRVLRAMRDDPLAATRVGKNIVLLRIAIQGVGGAFAGLSGALLAGFLGSWSPSAWTPFETLLFLTAVLVGGSGSDAGVALGTALVPILIVQGSQFLPAIPGNANLTPYGSIILFSVGTLAFMFLRPRGIIPERRPRIRESAEPPPEALVGEGRPVLTVRRGGEVAPLDAPAPPIVVIDGLRRHFGGVRAVDGVDLGIGRASITGLIGPNGAGKSTLLAMLTGTVAPDAGTITLDATDVTRMVTHRRARRGLVATSQLPQEFRRLTTIENLLVAATGQRGESWRGVALGRRYWRPQERAHTARAWELLRAFGMESKASELAANLSGGQKRLLEVMRALMLEPRVLLLDEPFAGLSPLMSDRLIDVCLGLARGGLTILVVEHDLGIVEELCEHVVVMARGTVIAQGTMKEMRQAPVVQNAYVSG